MSDSTEDECSVDESDYEESELELEQVPDADLNSLPDTSREKYLNTYASFNDWLIYRGIKDYSEKALLSYFVQMSETKKPNTLWDIYSQLKATLKAKHDIHIDKYPKIRAFLKKTSEEQKEEKAFTAKNVEKFLNEAPDSNFLATKVCLIIGISGGCMTNELANLTVNDVVKHSQNLLLMDEKRQIKEEAKEVMVVSVQSRKPKDRSFVIPNKYVELVEKYQALRPADTETDKFFIKYSNGKCEKQPTDKSIISVIPQIVATYLKLPDPDLYCLKRSSTMVCNDEEDLANLQDDNKQKPNTFTEIYIENPIESDCQHMISDIKIEICEEPSTETPLESRSASPAPLWPPSTKTSNIDYQYKYILEEEDPNETETTLDLQSDSDITLTSAELTKHSRKNSHLNTLPERTQEKYNSAYNAFNSWLAARGVESCSETDLLAYFTEMSKTRLPSTLWCTYSMLKTTLHCKEGKNIETYSKLLAFMKRASKGYTPRARVYKAFSQENVDKFLNEAPDYNYLALKVALIIGISGGCRASELINLTVKDIKKQQNSLLFTIPSREEMYQSFEIREKCYVDLILKYQALRPANTDIQRFFIRYWQGKCVKQPMGINIMCAVPRKVATFLKLPNPHLYRAHCLKKTGKAFNGSKEDCTALKRKSNTVEDTERYINIKIEQSGDSWTDSPFSSPVPSVSLSPAKKSKLEVHQNSSIDTEGLLDAQVTNSSITVPSKTTNLQSKSNKTLTPDESEEDLSYLPDKSREKYLVVYNNFNKWLVSKGAESCSETYMLSYFKELSKTRQPSTLWSIYSMLKATLVAKQNIYIGAYQQLVAFLRKSLERSKPKQSKTFTADDIEKFLEEAPDYTYLATKVGIIIAVTGACRSYELQSLTVDNIEKQSQNLVVNLPSRKATRSFVIGGKYVDIVEKYLALRPANAGTRFFIKYGQGKCVKQPMGINKLRSMPRKVAAYLELPDPHLYTGRCLRRTSATVSVDLEDGFTNLKCCEQWNSNTVPENYMQQKNPETPTFELQKPDDFWTCPSTSTEITFESSFASPASSLSLPSTAKESNLEDSYENSSIVTEGLLYTPVTNSTTVPSEETNLQTDSNTTLTLKQSKVKESEEDLSYLPDKSREKYLGVYNTFNEWLVSKGVECSETIMLSYFIEMSTIRQPSTLWSVYSMLKPTLKAKQNIHIETYKQVLVFLKKSSQAYKPKQSKTFTADEIEKFLDEAPDYIYLATKVGIIIAVTGGCRSRELLALTVDDIEKHSQDLLLVNLPTRKTSDRSFVIRGKYVDIVEKYLALRPANVGMRRFFIKYGKGKCVKQPMGINKLRSIPGKVAAYLELPDPHLYTGHCLRKTSATVLVDSGDGFTNLKRNVKVADNCIELPKQKKCKIATNELKNPEDFSTCPSTSAEISLESCSDTKDFPTLNLENLLDNSSEETDDLLNTQVDNFNLTTVESKNQGSRKNTDLTVLPDKSREKYFCAYYTFNDWLASKGLKSCTETIILSYFKELSKTRKPSTLWSTYSMLKATLKIKQNVHIDTYSNLYAYLKKAMVGCKPKASRTFTATNIEKFLNEARDNDYLAAKVGLIIGVTGGCRLSELLSLTVNNIENPSPNFVVVKLPDRRMQICRSFIIRGKHADIIEKYQALRPANAETERFLLQYNNGKCMKYPMGINKLAAIPKEVAIFLKLPEPHLYTGHCLKKTSAALSSRSGQKRPKIKSTKTASEPEGYLDSSVEYKSKNCNSIVDSISSRIGKYEDKF